VNAGRLRDGDRFPDGLAAAVGLVANVRRVRGAVAAEHARQRQDLGASAWQPGAVKSPDESPQAPAVRASARRRSISASSSAVTGRLSIPAVMSLSVLWPTWKMTLTEVAGNAAT